MEDAEVIDCVAAAVGAESAVAREARVTALDGQQGLLICRVALPDGRSYIFKALKESGRREIGISTLLSNCVPALVPRVVSAEQDGKRGLYWLITEDAGPRRLADNASIDGYIAAAVALANLQIASLEFVQDLSEAGAPSVTTEKWEQIALRVLETVAAGALPVNPGCDSLEHVVWSVSAMAADASAIPAAIVHGDIHAGNVALMSTPDQSCNPGSPIATIRLLDWGSAYLGAAFLGLEELLWPSVRHLRAPDHRGRVKAAYLREWASLLGKPGRLEKPVAACAALVRLELLDEALRRPHQYDGYAAAAIQRQLFEAFVAWKRA